MSKEAVNHPQHYGGENNQYGAIKVIEAWEREERQYRSRMAKINLKNLKI